jgi:hypothetical protein
LSSGCSDDTELDVREKAGLLLTGEGRKNWKIESFDIDEIPQRLTRCDSGYVLTIINNNTWEEEHLGFACFSYLFGYWELSDDANALKNTFYNSTMREWEVKHYEILELTEDIFTYRQVISRNRFKTVVMRHFRE